MSRRPIHPGEILRDKLMGIDITPTELSRQLKVPENRVPQIIAGKRSITADTALRLGKWFDMTPEFWLNLQKIYELRKAEQKIGKEISAIPTRAKEST